MNNEVRTPLEDAMFRAIAEQRKTDPLIGAKMGAKEVLSRLMQAMKDEKGVHLESLLCLLGALAGYACQASGRASGGLIHTMGGVDGKRYFFGDPINGPLVENKYSVWSLAAAAAQVPGGKELPDVIEIFRHVTTTGGTSEFGIPRIVGHKPGDLPINYLKAFWPLLVPQLKFYCGGPSEWPILFGIAIQETITAGKSALDPSDAARLVMECAVPMSKVDLDSHFQQNSAAPPVTGHTPTSAPAVRPQKPAAASPAARDTPPAPPSARAQHSATLARQSSRPVDDVDDDTKQVRQQPGRAGAVVAVVVVLAATYYTMRVVNFVPSKTWEDVSVGIGSVVAILFTFALWRSGIRHGGFSQHSLLRTIVAMAAAFFAVWWLGSLAISRIVGDIVARTIGQPITLSAQAQNISTGHRRWSCSPRLAGPNMGRGKCISRQLHEQLARTVDVTIQARQAWSGYTIDEIVINPNQKDDATRAVEAYFAAQRGASSGASSNSPSSSLSDAHRRCLEEVRRLAETPPPVPPNGDPSRIRAREQYVDEAKNAASYQDAVFAIFFFNREVNRLPSEPATPNIEPVEVFPSVDEPTYRESYCKARAVLTQTNYVGAAFQRRQGAASPESAMQRMKSEYPGYSDAIYNLVRDKSVEMQALDRP